MRIVFTGLTATSVKAAQKLIDQGHELIVIEIDKEKIDEVAEDLDCSFLHGNAGEPAILSQAAPEKCDFLFWSHKQRSEQYYHRSFGQINGF